MDVAEIIWLVALAVWALASRFAKARRSAPLPTAPPVAEDEAVGRSLRDVFAEIRRAFDEQLEPPPEAEPRARPAHVEFETPVVEEVEKIPPQPRLEPVRAQRRRRSVLTQGLIDDLRSGPASLSRAMVLMEVLGPPVALRDDPAKPGRS